MGLKMMVESKRSLESQQQRQCHIDKLTKTIEKLRGQMEELSRNELSMEVAKTRISVEKQIKRAEKRRRLLEQRPQRQEEQCRKKALKRLKADERRRLREAQGGSRKQTLSDYYASETWHRIREAYRERGPGRGSCAVCGSKSNLHVHHLVYRRPLGSELLDDLRHVCARCHELITMLHRTYRFSPYHATCMAMVVVTAPSLSQQQFDSVVSVCIPEDRRIPIPLAKGVEG